MLDVRVTSRELTMLRMIDVITDNLEWETNIFDNIVAESWREEARRKEPLLSTKAWGWCLEELRDKAPQFSQTRGVLVYDVGCRISKSSPRLVREVAEKLKAEVDRIVDQDPNRQKKASQLRCIVDPSLCPLVYVHTIVPPQVVRCGSTHPGITLARVPAPSRHHICLRNYSWRRSGAR